MTGLLYGMITAGFLIAAAHFFKFARLTGDSLFTIFGFAFLLLALNQALLATSPAPHDGEVLQYLPKLFAFVLLIAGIAHKNRRDRTPGA
jgi:hypothetical protein